jgi:cytochrome c oxidase subunit I+III
VLLLASSVVAWLAERQVERGRPRAGAGLLAVTFLMGAVFVAVQLAEWKAKSFGPGTSSYASLYYTTTGFHVAHVVAGLLILAALALWSALDFFSARRRIVVSAGVLYWHFVDVVWLAVFTSYYVAPYLGFGR